MKKRGLFQEKKCVSCGRFFKPDSRVGERQKCCPIAECRKKHKKLRDKDWRRKNPDYFQGRYEVVRAWRKEHPDYQTEWRGKKRLRAESSREKQGEKTSETPIKSIRIHLRVPLVLGEIQVQMLRVTQVGQAFWVDGAGTQAA